MGMPLVDSFGRVHTDLRVSLTDRCNLRCRYCMPEEGLAWLPREEVLTADEIVRLVRVGAERLGIRSVRLTGGEPLLRRDLVDIVGRLAVIEPELELAMTTNGIGLARTAAPLRDAGLRRINISLDTLRPERFAEITRRDRLADVIAGIEAASAAGLAPVKVNTVLMRGVNDDEVVDLVRFGIRTGCQVRFIEAMPLDAQGAWSRDIVISADEILATLGHEFDLVPIDHEVSAPAELWRIGGTDASVGIVASVTHAFCGSCNRGRLTADGQLRNCLFATEESDLRVLLRGGASDDIIEQAWRTSIAGKARGHGINEVTFQQPARPMSAIGG
ncbi:MAG: GTP 3',8-cyclase MoaA [Marmoricola sp.]